MPPKNPSSGADRAPLLTTLKRLGARLDDGGVSRIMVAEPAMEKFKAQQLPQHVEVIHKPLSGKRQTLRGRRNYNDARPVLAVWPDDNLDENSLPMVACCISGAVDFHIADYILKISTGDWVVFPPGVPKQDGSEPHLTGEAAGRSGDVLWMNTGVTRSDGLWLWACRSKDWEHSKLNHFRCRVEDQFLAELFNGFCEEMRDARRFDVVRRLLPLILYLLREHVSAGTVFLHESMGWCDARNGGQTTPIAEALSYIDGNLHRHLTIEKVAQHIAVSPATFTRYFKKETGETFGSYQQRRRIEMAERLLETTNLTVLHVCQRIGLQYSQMRKLFQKKHGLSPVEYRKRKK